MDNENNQAINLPASSSPTKLNFNFHGKTGEFWGIWIVNVLLSVLTLGIYSAWAKVRTNQYFLGSTEIDNHRFSYLATPMQILKGRIIAVVIFITYYFTSSFFPIVGIVLMIALMFLFPFLICSSLRFNMRMTSYRNVRFNFTGQYKDTFVNFILLPIASVFTLYLLLPWVLKRIDSFLIANTMYGNKSFEPTLSTGRYYKAAAITAVLSIVVMGLLTTVMFKLGTSIIPAEAGETPQFSGGMLIIMASFILLFNLIGAYYQATIRNHIFKETELNDVATFNSNYSFTSLAWLHVSNMLIIIGSVGLAYPWAKIRLANYAVTRTEIFALSGIDNVLDEMGEQSSALTEELANAFDIDVALT